LSLRPGEIYSVNDLRIAVRTELGTADGNLFRITDDAPVDDRGAGHNRKLDKGAAFPDEIQSLLNG
jgi:hypothetical protein